MSSIPEHESKGTHELPGMSTSLCQHCQAISLEDEKLSGFPFTPEDGEPFLYFGRDVEGDEGHFSIKVPGFREDEFPDLPRMQLSAANGCSLCGLLRSAVLNEFPPREVNREGPNTTIRTLILENFEYHWHSVEGYQEQEGSLAYLALLSLVAVIQDRDDELSSKIYFEVSAPPGLLATWLRIPWNVADENALSPARIRDIKSWISDCEQNCHHAGITEKLPRRLIDVGSEDGRDQMRLILSSDIQNIHHGAEYSKYATLSYCWGDRTSKPFFTTEKNILQQLRQSIPMECIPRAFYDAVVVTRSLGIRYLWIDALCIVQDDPEDWAKESAIMGEIYTNSYVTLIALQGESCHDGFLHRKTARKVPIYYKSSFNPHINGIYWLRQVSNGYASSRRSEGRSAAFVYDITHSRWTSRGWTLQEDLLSTRKLMFGAEVMYYDCGIRFWAENWNRRWALETWGRQFLDSLSEDLGPKEVYLRWYSVVEFYNNRDLTYSTDRLPALSGLAQRMHEKIAGHYLAGLWRSDLFDGLLWLRLPWTRPVMSRATFIDSVVRPKHYIAPTWSWARSQSKASFVCHIPPNPENDAQIKILDARTALTGQNSFGSVQDGHLLLRGKTFGLAGARIFGIDGTGVDCEKWMQGDIWLEAISHNNFEIARCFLDWQPFEAAEDFELCEAPWDQLMMMIVSSHSIHTKLDKEEDEKNNSSEELRGYFGLLLLPTTRGADSWVRVGVCMLRSDMHGRTILENCSERVVRVV